MSELISINCVGTAAPGQNLRDPMYKSFDVVSSFGHFTYSMYIIFDSAINEKENMFPYNLFVVTLHDCFLNICLFALIKSKMRVISCFD